ncbi:hypothetical protein WN943_001438 [Citrus x changshan-huyou]
MTQRAEDRLRRVMLVLLLIVVADGDHHTVDCCLETPSAVALTVLLGHAVVDGPSEACGEGVGEGHLFHSQSHSTEAKTAAMESSLKQRLQP